MRQMTLHNIAQACGGRLVLTENRKNGGKESDLARGAGETVTELTEITGAELDSRKTEAGNLFFATVGERVDGHRFLAQVFEKGAVCAVVSKTPEQVEEEHGISAEQWGAYILVEDTLKALREIAEYYRSTWTIPVIGITGSVGKTSTKEFIAGVLSQKYRVLKTEGNFNNEIGLPLTLLRVRPEHEAAVVEMGISDFGEMRRLSKMARPDICVITNIGQCHLENLKTRDGILLAKTEMFEYMSPNGEVCLNGDDDKLASIEQVHGKKPHFFGLGENPLEEVVAGDIVSRGMFGSKAVLRFETGEENGRSEETEVPGEQSLFIDVPLPGIHMVNNAAAAACVGRLLGLSREQIAEGIRRVTPVGGRSNLIRTARYTIIDDCYNANPVSMKAAIDLLTTADTEKTAVLGDMFELGEDSDAMHEEVGRYAAEKGIDVIVCIGEHASHMFKGAVAAAAARQKVYHFDTKTAFFEADKKESLIPEASAILVKASHGMSFPEIIEYFKDQSQTDTGLTKAGGM